MAGFKVSSLLRDYKKTTISGDYAIAANDPSIHFLTPSASDLSVKLPQTDSLEIGAEFVIYNLSAEYSLTVKDSAGLSEIATIEANSSVALTFSGDGFVQGPKGPKGDQGVQGETGPQGPVGPEGTGTGAASKAGVANITNNSDTVEVVFDEAFDEDATFVVTCSVSNTVDVNASLVAAMITAKSKTGFTAKLSAKVSTANYKLEWMAR